MKAAKTPKAEKARLEALRSLNLLDTPAEDRFDRLTRMAKRVFDVPISLVSLVDKDRQWFKSCTGLEVSETARDISFCGHAILGDDIFYIHDTAKDRRFADNPLVVNEPHIRFYAGCPLHSLHGFKLGTLCIIDRKPRTLSAEDLACLQDLALMVEREIAAIQLATMDELTGLNNRRGFMHLAENSLKLCTRQEIPVSLVYMDLNKFKAINDQFGHAEGDRALSTFAEELRMHGRDSDIVARLSGDEFVMLLTDSSKGQSRTVVERFKETLGQLNAQAGRGYDITFSHGICEYDREKHPTIDALLSAADAMMYRNKAANAAATNGWANTNDAKFMRLVHA